MEVWDELIGTCKEGVFEVVPLIININIERCDSKRVHEVVIETLEVSSLVEPDPALDRLGLAFGIREVNHNRVVIGGAQGSLYRHT